MVTISDKYKVKEKGAEHFENVLNSCKATVNAIKMNKKNFVTLLKGKKNLFCEEKLELAKHGLRIIKPQVLLMW